MYEKFEKIEYDIYVTEKKLKAAENKKKALEQSVRKLTRNERTHRLCTRGGMLEAFLKQPTILTDEDVMELLTFLFRSEEAQNKLSSLIEERMEETELAGV